jgi:hypothetical protein
MTDRGKEIHELGNSIVALQFCLRRLEGRQHTDELEGLVRGGLEVCEQAIVAFRKVHQAASLREGAHAGHDERARRYEMRAAEYHAVADQMQSPTARATYRRLAESCESIVTAGWRNCER